MAKRKNGPQFVAYLGPILDALRALGSSGRPAEVRDWIAEHVDVPPADIEETTKSGQTRFENQVHWGRFYLAKSGLISTAQRGVWALTEKGRETHLDHPAAIKIAKAVQAEVSQAREDAGPKSPRGLDNASVPTPQTTEVGDDIAPDESAYVNESEARARLVEILRGLTPVGFEEFTARVLRHIGFESVSVTQATRDGGVDGEGYLRINRFVRTKIMFQCKRYEGTVGPDRVQAFRGAIHGRAERGIILTTGTFTSGAKNEAARDNATPIQLVDIDGLVDLLIEEGLGVVETKALSIDEGFFKQYARQ